MCVLCADNDYKRFLESVENPEPEPTVSLDSYLEELEEKERQIKGALECVHSCKTKLFSWVIIYECTAYTAHVFLSVSMFVYCTTLFLLHTWNTLYLIVSDFLHIVSDLLFFFFSNFMGVMHIVAKTLCLHGHQQNTQAHSGTAPVNPELAAGAEVGWK